jgi:hypothetical protein
MPPVRRLGRRAASPVAHAQPGVFVFSRPAWISMLQARGEARAEEWPATCPLERAAQRELPNPDRPEEAAMGAYCTLVYTRRHSARMGEIMEVRRPYPGYPHVAVFGDNDEIACIPHRGCRLEIAAVPETAQGELNLLLPGQVVRYTRSFFFGDRLELPSGRKVGFDRLVGFKLQLAGSPTAAPPKEETVAKNARTGSADSVAVAAEPH